MMPALRGVMGCVVPVGRSISTKLVIVVVFIVVIISVCCGHAAAVSALAATLLVAAELNDRLDDHRL